MTLAEVEDMLRLHPRQLHDNNTRNDFVCDPPPKRGHDQRVENLAELDARFASAEFLQEIPLLTSHAHRHHSKVPSEMPFSHRNSHETAVHHTTHHHSSLPTNSEHTEMVDADPRRAACDPVSSEPPSPDIPATLPAAKSYDSVTRQDPNSFACEEAGVHSEPSSPTTRATFVMSQSQPGVARNKPDFEHSASDFGVGASKTDLCSNSPRGDDIVDVGKSCASASSEEMARGAGTPAIVVFHADDPKPTIKRSCSTPDFKVACCTTKTTNFENVSVLARAVSDFARYDSDPRCAEVATTSERDACEDVLQGIEPRVIQEEGGKDSLSKSGVYHDIPETTGTFPSGCKTQRDSGKDLNKTRMFPASEDDFATDMSPADPDHREPSMDSSTSLYQLESEKPGLAHSTPALASADSVCSSSDLERVENGEKITPSPHEIKRTYSSSVDTLVEEDIETLTTTSIQHTIFSVTNSDASHPTSSSLLTSSNSAVHQPRSVENIPDSFDIERDPLSASSADAEGAWRDDHSFPRPHSRVKRMYSSSESDYVPDFEESIQSSDSVPEALANNQWDAYVSECRRCSSTLEGRELERLSRSGRIPRTGFTSSEPMSSMDSLRLQAVEATPLLRRHSSRPTRQRSHSEGRTRRGMKSAVVRRATRLLNFVLGKKSRSGRNQRESQAKMKKRSLPSLWGRCS